MPFTPGGSTPVFHLPYLLETDVPDVAAASQQLALAVESALEAVAVPIGADLSWWSTTLPTYGQWAFMNGQRLVNAATNYPTLFAMFPGWQRTNAVSGLVADLVIPNTQNLVPMGAGGTYAGGATGGSATVTLLPANIPQITSSVSLPSLNHSHGGATGTESAQHNHSFPVTGILTAPTPGTGNITVGSGPDVNDVVVITGLTTGAENASHAHGIPADLGSPGSGSVTIGSNTPTGVANIPPFIASYRILRLA